MTEYLWMTFWGEIEIFKYLFAYKVFLHKNCKGSMKKLVLYFTLSVVITFCCNIFQNSVPDILVIFVCGIIIPIVFIEGNKKDNVLAYLVIVFSLSIVDMVGGIFTYLVFQWKISDEFANIFGLIVILGFYCWRKNTEALEINIKLKQYLVLTVGLCGCVILLAGMNCFLRSKSDDTMLMRCNVCGTIVCILFLVVSINQIFVISREEAYRRENIEYKTYLELQNKHLEDLIQNNCRIKAVRHDVRAHLLAIESMIKQKKYEGLCKYINKIREESGICEMLDYCGNPTVDAIIIDCIEIAKKKGIGIQWTGKIPEENVVDAYDWCVLISNLLKNAICACDEIGEQLRIIKVAVYAYNDRIFLKVCNPVLSNIQIKNNELITTKKNKNRHGFGSQNIKKVIERYNGSVKYSCENLVFSVEILI